MTKIFIVSLVFCSCVQGTYERNGGSSRLNTTTENTQTICSWDEDLLDGEKVFTIVEQMPDYEGGMGNYYELIGKDIIIPDDQKMWQSITVVFIVDTLGKVRNECILNKDLASTMTTVEEEVLKVVKKRQD